MDKRVYKTKKAIRDAMLELILQYDKVNDKNLILKQIREDGFSKFRNYLLFPIIITKLSKGVVQIIFRAYGTYDL